VEAAVSGAAAVAENHIDLTALWRIADNVSSLEVPEEPDLRRSGADQPVIGVIRDRAFQFYYPENLEALEREGAAIQLIDALDDRELPEIDALYIGGGFPETQAAELAANRSFCRSVKQAAENGLPVYAECGGLIYLGRSLRVGDKDFEMTSVFPADFVLEKKPQAHGYTSVEVRGDNPFFEKDSTVRGHEFHYSRVVNSGDLSGLAFTMLRGRGIDGAHDGLIFRNVLATYTHIHALGTPSWATGMVKRAREHRMSSSRGAR
jgi:cobyrinic acid a,c-diamide synthase